MVTDKLPIELIQNIYEQLPVQDLIALSQTSKQFRSAYLGQQVPLLMNAVEATYGPIQDLLKLSYADRPDNRHRKTKLLTARNTAKERVREVINVPPQSTLNVRMILKLIPFGEVAERWVEIWPRLHWRYDSENRRLLTSPEQKRLRSAIYRFWIYNTLFQHTPFHAGVEDTTHFYDARRWDDDPRLQLMRTYSSLELIQVSEVVQRMQEVLEKDVCPSNTTVMAEMWPITEKALSSLGWGDSSAHRYLIQVFLKLRPGEILHLSENTWTKAERMSYLLAEGGHFQDSPSTIQHAAWFIIADRQADFVDERTSAEWGIIKKAGKEESEYDSVVIAKDADPKGAWPSKLSNMWPADAHALSPYQ